MTDAERFIEAARAYIGTPFVHQGRLKGVGVDCAGLIACAGRDAGLIPSDWSGDSVAYPRITDGTVLASVLSDVARLAPDGALEPGDILTLRCVARPIHLAIYTGGGRMIHAYAIVGRVVEHSMGAKWERRIHAVYRLKNAERPL